MHALLAHRRHTWPSHLRLMLFGMPGMAGNGVIITWAKDLRGFRGSFAFLVGCIFFRMGVRYSKHQNLSGAVGKDSLYWYLRYECESRQVQQWGVRLMQLPEVGVEKRYEKRGFNEKVTQSAQDLETFSNYKLGPHRYKLVNKPFKLYSPT